MDRALNSQESRAKLILVSPKKVIKEYALIFEFKTFNNGIEYEVLITNLKIAKELEM